MGQVLTKEIRLQLFLAWVELGRSFHQLGTVKLKVHASDIVSFWDGTKRFTCRTQASGWQEGILKKI